MKFGIREIAFLVVMIGLLAAIKLLVWDKAQTKIVGMERKTEERLKALADLERATSGVSDVDKKVAELEEAIKFFEKKLPQERDIDQILKEVWNMAETNQLTTKTIKTMKSQRGTAYSEQPIEMSLSGNFAGFYEFLLKLEKLPRLTRINQLSLDKINGREGEMDAKLTLSIFFEPDNAGSGAAAASAR
jgi:type IV pilus assembly protein PilO